MTEQPEVQVRLLGLDGDHLVLGAPDGGRFRLEITEMLRAAVRRDRPAIEQLRALDKAPLSPRDIQARIRSGMSAGELADTFGVPVEHVRRYEGPVLAERQYIAGLARSAPVSGDGDSPHLEDVVVDRLAQRGVDVSDLVWDAYRSDTHGWLVSVTFDLDDTISQAQWTFRPSSKSLTAIDGQARWLSETRLTGSMPVVAPTPGRHLSAVGAEVFDVEAFQQPRETSPADSQEATQALLDELDRLRGVRTGGFPHVGDMVQDPPSVSGAPASENRPRSAPVPIVDNDARVYVLSAPSAQPVDPAVQSTSTASTRSAPEAVSPIPGRPGRPSTVSARTGSVPVTPQAHRVSDQDDAPPHTGSFTPPRVGSAEPGTDVDVFGDPVDERTVGRSGRRNKGRQRSPMPSWDEIVFGTRTD